MPLTKGPLLLILITLLFSTQWICLKLLLINTTFLQGIMKTTLVHPGFIKEEKGWWTENGRCENFKWSSVIFLSWGRREKKKIFWYEGKRRALAYGLLTRDLSPWRGGLKGQKAYALTTQGNGASGRYQCHPLLESNNGGPGSFLATSSATSLSHTIFRIWNCLEHVYIP